MSEHEAVVYLLAALIKPYMSRQEISEAIEMALYAAELINERFPK